MKAAIRDQWIKDLRSGEFKQGSKVLERVETASGRHELCCLGVLCRQAVAAGVIPAPELHGSVYYYLDDQYDEYGFVIGEAFIQSGSLPRKVQEWAGVTGGEGDVYLNAEQSPSCRTAIEANDMDNQSFVQIADLIELFVPAE